MVSVEPRRSQQAVQLALWPVFETSKSNMVALYDLAPRFVFEARPDGDGKKTVIDREFSFGGKRYKITMKPTRLVLEDQSEIDRYLGEREQIVEEVIRRLASGPNRLTLIGDNKVRFPFTLNEVRTELKRVKHTYNLDEIREAITLLNEVRIRIEEVDSRKSALLSAPAFPVMGMRRRGDDGDRETFVEFNPLVADAIRTLAFQQVAYEVLMEIRDPVARWLLKRLHLEISETGDPVQSMAATEIRRDSGMPEWKTTRNLLRRISAAVNLLVHKGILDKVETEELKNRQRKEDIIFVMRASPGFLAEVQRSVQLAKENIEDFARVTNGQTPTTAFIPISTGEAFKLREKRRQALPRRGAAAE